MSPFEAASDEVAAQVRGLSVRSAVGLFWAGSVALTRDYAQWCSAVPADSEIERLDEAQLAAREIGPGLLDLCRLGPAPGAGPAQG